ncbi:hypothetical protein ACFVWR_18320 [Leifsonia sp. NPDC058292]|uniref:hypothetical protein n=1 Tax=Leifsonia sp. NPDC058292 TaxID=3346428 RepID=UPI0036D8EA79
MPEPTYSDDFYAHLRDRANTVAAELHRRLTRLHELGTGPERRDPDAEHVVRGETIGLRNALGILLQPPGGNPSQRFIEHVGDNYYLNWMKEQKDQCPSRVHSLWYPCPDDCTKPLTDETQQAREGR